MPPPEPVLPPCGHTDRLTQLTELAVAGVRGDPLYFLVCTVPSCPEYCRVFVDLRDPAFLGYDQEGPDERADDDQAAGA